MNLQLKLHQIDGTVLTMGNCITFSLLRDRYLPYAILNVKLLCDAQLETPPIRAQFWLDGMLLHDGIVRSCQARHVGNRLVLEITARGFTEALLHNQLVPGLHTHVTLASLMTTYALPNVTYENIAEEINYVYVKENAAMWETVAAYNYKFNHGYPYVTLCNHLRLSPKPDQTPLQLPAHAVIETACGGDSSTLISRIDMANIDGVYGTHTYTNPEATARKIVRVKQISMDRQFLHVPLEALTYRTAYSNRRLVQKSVSYQGYCGEDLEDCVALEGFVAGHVSRILLIGDTKGLRTTDTLYFDSFCNTT